MIEEILMFRTSDNKLHETEAAAKEHNLNRVRELIDKKLKPLTDKGKLTRADTFSIVMTLLENYEDACLLQSGLNRIL